MRRRSVCDWPGQRFLIPAPLDADAFLLTETICDEPFSKHAVGCVYFVKLYMTWCEARQYCTSLGADLTVVQPKNFPALQQFLLDNANGEGEFP